MAGSRSALLVVATGLTASGSFDPVVMSSSHVSDVCPFLWTLKLDSVCLDSMLGRNGHLYCLLNLLALSIDGISGALPLSSPCVVRSDVGLFTLACIRSKISLSVVAPDIFGVCLCVRGLTVTAHIVLRPVAAWLISVVSHRVVATFILGSRTLSWSSRFSKGPDVLSNSCVAGRASLCIERTISTT